MPQTGAVHGAAGVQTGNCLCPKGLGKVCGGEGWLDRTSKDNESTVRQSWEWKNIPGGKDSDMHGSCLGDEGTELGSLAACHQWLWAFLGIESKTTYIL